MLAKFILKIFSVFNFKYFDGRSLGMALRGGIYLSCFPHAYIIKYFIIFYSILYIY